jgi:hypothetical protein
LGFQQYGFSHVVHREQWLGSPAGSGYQPTATSNVFELGLERPRSPISSYSGSSPLQLGQDQDHLGPDGHGGGHQAGGQQQPGAGDDTVSRPTALFYDKPFGGGGAAEDEVGGTAGGANQELIKRLDPATIALVVAGKQQQHAGGSIQAF